MKQPTTETIKLINEIPRPIVVPVPLGVNINTIPKSIIAIPKRTWLCHIKWLKNSIILAEHIKCPAKLIFSL